MTAIGALIGATIGGLTAWKRKGNVLDILQYAAAYAIAFALLGLIAGLIWMRAG